MNELIDSILDTASTRRRLRQSLLTRIGRVSLRDARLGDADSLHALLLGIAEEGRAFLMTPGEHGVDAAPSRALLSDTLFGGGVAVVAVHGQVLLGYALARRPRWTRLSHIRHFEMALATEARGQGIGGALLDGIIDRLSLDPHVQKLSLSVFADNAPALGLYRSRGFVEEGRRIGEIQEADGTLRDDVLMTLRFQRGAQSP